MFSCWWLRSFRLPLPVFDAGDALRVSSQNMWAEIMLSFTSSDHLEVLTRALAVTFDLVKTACAYDLECSRSFVTLSLPRLSNFLSVLDWANAPPVSLLHTGVPFDPLTVAEHEATTPPTPPTPTTPPSEPYALPRCRRVAGLRRRTLRHLPAPLLPLRPPGLSFYFTRGKRGRYVPPPPLFRAP